MNRANRMALLIATLMLSTSIGTLVARQVTKVRPPELSVEAMIPKQFGDWLEQPSGIVEVVDPQLQEQLDKDYSEIVNRYYVNAERYMIMLSVAYGSGPGPLKLHKPETCYSGSGFTVLNTRSSRIETPFGTIPARRLLTSKGPREEPVTYWLTVGDMAVTPWQSKLVELGHVLTGRVPDGLVFRISSIDRDLDRATQLQDQFVSQLLASVSSQQRKRLSGLGE